MQLTQSVILHAFFHAVMVKGGKVVEIDGRAGDTEEGRETRGEKSYQALVTALSTERKKRD